MKAEIKFIIYFFLAVGGFSCQSVLAADWYVSQEGSGAKDGTSPSNAWQTTTASSAGPLCKTTGCINWNAMNAGDTLYIIGTLHNIITFPVGTSGSENNYFTIKGYDGNSGIVLGVERNGAGWSDAGFNAYSGSYSATILGIIEWTDNPLDNIKLNNRGKPPDSDWRDGDYYYDTTSRTIYYRPSDGILINKHLTFDGYLRIVVDGVAWVKIENLKHFITGYNLGRYTSSNHIWLNNLTISYLSTIGIAVNQVGDLTGNDYGRISYCDITDAPNGIYLMSRSTVTNENHWLIDHNNITNIHGSNDAHGIGIQGGENNIIEYNNISHANTGITMWTGASTVMSKNIIRYNHIHNLEGNRGDGRAEGIGWEGTNLVAADMSGNQIYGNIVHDCAPAGNYVGSGGGGIRPKFIDPSNVVYNNVVRNCDPNYFFQGVSSSYPVGAVIKNNISLDPVSDHWSVSAYNNGVYSGLTFNNNLYYPDDGTKFKFKGVSLNFLNWKTALENNGVSLAEENSLNSDAMLANSSGSYSQAGDFHLQPASPAIDAGADVGLTSDFEGNPIVGTPDIGAYEYQEGNDIVLPSPPAGLSVR